MTVGNLKVLMKVAGNNLSKQLKYFHCGQTFTRFSSERVSSKRQKNVECKDWCLGEKLQ